MASFSQRFFVLIKAIWRHLVDILITIGRAALDILFRLIDLIAPLTSIANFVRIRLPGVWSWLLSLGFIKRMISRNVFRKFGNAAPPRPHAFTMAAPYANWIGFVDRRFTGRHLPERPDPGNLPDEAQLVDLFLRPTKENDNATQIDCIRSTVMFAAFAQWFTDSFLRTAHAFKFDEDGNVIRDATGAPLREPDREKYNTSNHEIDLCQIYGLNEHQTDVLRLKDDPQNKGCLKFQLGDDGEYPPFLLKNPPSGPDKKLDIRDEFADLHPDERIIRSIFRRADHNNKGYETIFAAGLEHSNATIGNALLNTIFLREHNRVARLISSAYPIWDDERVFQTTRNVMIVLLLKIVISDYIRHISPLNLPLEFQPGFAETQHWYRTNRISIEFNILYRWHGLVPDEFDFMPTPSDPNSFRHNNKWLIDTGVAAAVEKFSAQRAGKIIIGNTPRYLAGVKLDTIRLMRGAKLATYNDYRKRLNLAPAESFQDVTTDTALAAQLSSLYGGDVDNLEWYIGMLSEDHGTEMIMGEMLTTFVAHDAFTQALTNPLLSNEAFTPHTFSEAGWRVINETTTLSDVVNRVAGAQKEVVCRFGY